MTIINDLGKLYPPFAEQLKQLDLLLRNEGIEAYPFETYRSFDRQMELYKLGRSFNTTTKAWEVVDANKVVTKALPGKSWHAYGVAADYVFKVDGKWSWNLKMPWKKVGKLGESVGLEWGGNWVEFKDLPHFQNTYGATLKEAYSILVVDNIQGVWDYLDKLRSVK